MRFDSVVGVKDWNDENIYFFNSLFIFKVHVRKVIFEG